MADLLRGRRPQNRNGGVPLRHAPPEAPGIQDPSRFGAALGYEPTFSLGDQIGRWYENAGGLDKAVDSAQQSMANRDPKVLDGLLWPKWEKKGLDEKFPVSRERDQRIPNANGTFDWSDRRIRLSPGVQNHQAVLEHEGSHGLFMPGNSGAKQRAAAADRDRWDVPHGDKHTAYLMDPAEVDVRLAEIKRRYAHHTGRLVDSPEEAQKAFDWWKTYNLNFSPEINEGREKPIERPSDGPTTSRRATDTYDQLPEPMKQQLLHRMPEVVKSEDRIRELRRA